MLVHIFFHSDWSQMINQKGFVRKVNQKFDQHLNEYEGTFTVDQVGTRSVSSHHEQIMRIAN